MLDQISKYTALIPAIAILVYILGYITVTSYLQSFGINDSVGFDFIIVRLGMLLTIIIAPVIILSFADFNIGNFERAHPDTAISVIDILHDALGYTILYSFSIATILFKSAFDWITKLMLVFVVVGLILNKAPIPLTLSKYLKGFFIVIPFFTIVTLMIAYQVNPRVSLYLLTIAMFTSCAFFRIFNKPGVTFQASKIGSVITALVFGAGLFGGFIVKGIPVQYGGEAQHIVNYYLTDQAVKKISYTELGSSIIKNRILSVNKIYESGEKYYFKTKSNKVVAVPKDFIDLEEISKPSGY